jgi:signal transduction histidine kinase
MAHITAEYTGGLLRIEVTDDGKGFNIDKIQPGNGLQNMQKRCDAMHGSLIITSTPGKGTNLTLSLKIG